MAHDTINEMTSFGEFEVVRNVTLPFLIIPADGAPYYLKFNTAIAPDTTTFSERVRKRRADADGKPQSKEPMDIAEITNLQSGEVGRLVFLDLLKNNLREAYPNDGYVGLYFKISKTKGKGFFNFNIVEIKLKTKDAVQKTAEKK